MNNSQSSLFLTRFVSFKLAAQRLGVMDFSKMIKIQKQIKQFETEGLDTDLSDVFPTNNGEFVTVLRDGSIRKAVIHIVDISHWRDLENTPLQDLIPKQLPKFHIYECNTIEQMRERNKGHIYKASAGKGDFIIIRKVKNKEEKCSKELQVCKNCLKKYNKQFKTNETTQTFSLKEYQKKPIIHDGFKNMPLDICTVPNSYTRSWKEISRIRKEQENWRCQSCGGNFSKKECREFLHTHHVNADKKDNRLGNLKVLCIECHSKESNHEHIRNDKQYKKFKQSKCCTNI